MSEASLKNLSNFLSKHNKIYSYFIRVVNNQVVAQYIVSDNDKYNTIEPIAENIFTTLANHNIAFRQPPLELMLEIYSPLCKSLAAKTIIEWPRLEYDDCYQLAQLTMLKLYRKNYYIHKSLFIHCYQNDVYMYLRQYKKEPPVTSIETLLAGNTDEDNDLTLNECLVADPEDDTDDTNEDWLIIKPLILLHISDRQLQHLLFEYSTHNVSAASNKCIRTLRKIFEKNNIKRYKYE